MKKAKMIFLGLLVLVLIAIIVLVIVKANDKDEKTDAMKFKEEYSEVADDNVFVYKDIDEIIDIMEDGSGVIYLGFPECPWCQAYVKYLDEVAKEMEIDEVYYYNIYEDRKNNTENYKKIVKLLSERLQKDEDGNKRVFVPNVSFHANGKLVGNNNETSFDTNGIETPSDYWTEEEVKDLRASLVKYMTRVIEQTSTCTDCNKK